MDVYVNLKSKVPEDRKKDFFRCIKNLSSMQFSKDINWEPFFVLAIIGESLVLAISCIYYKSLTSWDISWYLIIVSATVILYAIVIQFFGKMPYIRRLVKIMDFPFLLRNKGKLMVITNGEDEIIPKSFRINVKSYKKDYDIIYFFMDSDKKIHEIGECHIDGKGTYRCNLSIKDLDVACEKAFHMKFLELLRWKKELPIYMGYIENSGTKNVTIYADLYYKIPMRYVNVIKLSI